MADYSSPSFQITINNLKIMASEWLYEVVDELVQLCGLRYGYVRNEATRLERTLRDLRSASLMFSNDRLSKANGKLVFVDGKYR